MIAGTMHYCKKKRAALPTFCGHGQGGQRVALPALLVVWLLQNLKLMPVRTTL